MGSSSPSTPAGYTTVTSSPTSSSFVLSSSTAPSTALMPSSLEFSMSTIGAGSFQSTTLNSLQLSQGSSSSAAASTALGSSSTSRSTTIISSQTSFVGSSSTTVRSSQTSFVGSSSTASTAPSTAQMLSSLGTPTSTTGYVLSQSTTVTERSSSTAPASTALGSSSTSTQRSSAPASNALGSSSTSTPAPSMGRSSYSSTAGTSSSTAWQSVAVGHLLSTQSQLTGSLPTTDSQSSTAWQSAAVGYQLSTRSQSSSLTRSLPTTDSQSTAIGPLLSIPSSLAGSLPTTDSQSTAVGPLLSTSAIGSRLSNAIGSDFSNAQSGKVKSILHISFNQNKSCFAVGNDKGYQIYQCYPFLNLINRTVPPFGAICNSGFKIVEMHYTSNIVALVGDGTTWDYPTNKVFLSDESEMVTPKSLVFNSKVIAVRLSVDRIVVILEKRIYVYPLFSTEDPHLIHTRSNPHGACDISHPWAPSPLIIVSPGDKEGAVNIHNLNTKGIREVMAHTSDARCLSLTPNGKFFASTSVKGTVIKIHSIDGVELRRLRRGFEEAKVTSLTFSSDFYWLVASSDTGTIHVFKLFDLSKGVATPVSDSHAIGTMRRIREKLQEKMKQFINVGERSRAKYFLPGSTYVAEFGLKNTVVIAGIDGSYITCEFDPIKGGEMILVDSKSFYV